LTTHLRRVGWLAMNPSATATTDSLSKSQSARCDKAAGAEAFNSQQYDGRASTPLRRGCSTAIALEKCPDSGRKTNRRMPKRNMSLCRFRVYMPFLIPTQMPSHIITQFSRRGRQIVFSEFADAGRHERRCFGCAIRATGATFLQMTRRYSLWVARHSPSRLSCGSTITAYVEQIAILRGSVGNFRRCGVRSTTWIQRVKNVAA
jgi:hypothetical protein